MYSVYKIISKITNEYYIGVHKTNNVNDSYYGSGIIIKRKIKKYGKENFQKIILNIFDTQEEAFEEEKRLLKENLNNPMCLNIANGGQGGSNFAGKHHSEETKEKLRKISFGRKMSEETKHKIIETRKKNGTLKCKDSTKIKLSQLAKNRYITDEVKIKISNGLKAYHDKVGRKNKIRKKYHHLEHDKNSKMSWINKDGSSRLVYEEEIDNFLKDGWKIGRDEYTKIKTSIALKGKCCGKENSVFGTKWMYNEELRQTKMVKPESFEEYLESGWKFGCKNKVYY